MNTKLAIVGAGLTQYKAPFDDESYDIWTTGNVSASCPRVTGIIEVHTNAMQDPKILNGHDCPVWMQEIHQDIPKSEKFPIQELVNHFGKIFDCSMTMLLGLAYYKGYRDIELFGVDLADKESYEKYRANFLYLLGLGRGEGRRISISHGSLLMRDKLLYCYEHPGVIQQRVLDQQIQLAKQLEETQRQKETASERVAYLRGASDMMRELQKLYGG